MLLALICAAVVAQDDGTKVKVVDGKVEGVFYGWSPVLDLWGNIRRGMWTLRKDGALYFGAPEGSFEDFTSRALTADEKKECGTYTIDGEKFAFTHRDGSPGEGSVIYDADGCVKTIKAATMRYFPVRRGISFELAGFFTSVTSFSNNAYKMSTTAYSSYSFHKNGLFVLESGSSTTCRTADSRDAMHGELSAYFGTEAKDRIGRWEAKGSGLTLTFDSGVKQRLFLGQISGAGADGSVMMLLGRSIYEGVPGKFPSEILPACKADQFELVLPKGWTSKESESAGLRLFTLAPSEEGLAVLALGLDVDAWATASDAATQKDLRTLVAGWMGQKLADAGDVEAMTVDGGEAVRIPMKFDREGTTIRVDAIYAVKSGRAMLLVAVGTEEGAKARAAEIRAILVRARFAVDETAKAEIDGVEFKVAKAWKTAKADNALSLTPPDVKEGEFFAAVATQATELKSAADKKGIAWLRQQVEEAIPGLQSQGDPERLVVDDSPAVGVRYAAKTDAGDVIVVIAYAVVKHGKVAMVIAGGKAAAVTKHGGAARRAFETVRIRK